MTKQTALRIINDYHNARTAFDRIGKVCELANAPFYLHIYKNADFFTLCDLLEIKPCKRGEGENTDHYNATYTAPAGEYSVELVTVILHNKKGCDEQ